NGDKGAARIGSAEPDLDALARQRIAAPGCVRAGALVGRIEKRVFLGPGDTVLDAPAPEPDADHRNMARVLVGRAIARVVETIDPADGEHRNRPRRETRAVASGDRHRR